MIKNILTVVNYMRQLSDKCISFVCESLFNAPDKSNQNYSFDEFDFYVKIPKRTDMRNHRLTLYKNLTTENFEVYRQFMQEYKISAKIEDEIADVTTQIDTDLKETAKRGTLKECLDFVNQERKKYWKFHNLYCICKHQYPQCALHCTIV